jgi:hypothetical protein
MRLISWLALITTASAGSAVFGLGIGLILAHVSGDYVVVPSDYLFLGLRGGLAAGVAMAGLSVMARQSVIGPREGVRMLAVWGLTAMGVVLAAGIVGLLLPLLQITVPQESNLGHPRRHLLFLSVQSCLIPAVFLGAFASGWYSCLRRRSLDAVRNRQPQQEVDRE